MIIKVIQNREKADGGIAVYCYEADSYVFINDRKDPKKQCVVIRKDGKDIEKFGNPCFDRFFICNNNGKTIDTIEFNKNTGGI